MFFAYSIMKRAREQRYSGRLVSFFSIFLYRANISLLMKDINDSYLRMLAVKHRDEMYLAKV